ncbi:PREDICTED: uncharacterized protein LOC105953830 [Erythranthe guttata]|uniref:uncharacterized protein LOC105953830 n=1 Tax=Erythranthe guttata TaxID=4155 RepID=UPI00064D85C5|nr:PREDICTED: uncharacterized protein LOC105953830 [Erythranthe guttata]|eukprot:XP_012832963.1 PREDICTED: uncharacterized protein LOC105953830 [Erythranthe guttata]
MASCVTLVLKFDGVFGVKNCTGDFTFEELIGFVSTKFNGLQRNNVAMSYNIPGGCEGVLGDDDDVLFMLSSMRELSMSRIDVVIKQRLGDSRGLVGLAPVLPNTYERDVDRGVLSVNPRSLVTAGPPQLMTASWANLIIDVGQVFEGGAKDFRKALCLYAIEMGFEFRYVKNERVRVTAVCKDKDVKDCMWRILASIEHTNGFFYIRRYVKHHTCGSGFATSSKKRLTSDIIAELVMCEVTSKPGWVANDVVVHAKLHFGIDISYYVGWRTIQASREHIFGDHTTSYSYLPSYFDELVRTNPESVYHLDIDQATNRFRRCFFVVGACLMGFKSCRPVLSVDGTLLKGKHREILLAAVGKDGQNALFPVVFAVVNEETDCNWAYFFEHLKSAIGTERTLTFVSDRNNGILKGVKNIFPGCFHSFCVYHIEKNLMNKFRGSTATFRKAVSFQFNACVYAATKEEFDQNMENFRKNGGPRVDNFLCNLPPENWVHAYFGGRRYGQVASSGVESWNSSISDVRGLPITNMIDGIRSKMMVDMFFASNVALKWTSVLCKKVQDMIDGLVQDARVITARQASDDLYEVLSDPVVVVDIRSRSCSCRMWQINGLPCVHAVCVLFKYKKTGGYDYLNEHVRTDCYRRVYSHTIVPFVTDAGRPPAVEIGAPVFKPQRGRPKNKRIPSVGENISMKIKCSRCNHIGTHNKRTCIRSMA